MKTHPELDAQQLQALEQKFDPEMQFRPVVPPATVLVRGLLIALSLFHFYTAGFGLLREATHRGVHLAFVLGLIFLVFAATRLQRQEPQLDDTRALELATAIATDATVLVTDHPALAQTGQHPVLSALRF